MKCGECKDTGWIEAEGRLGLEIQMCQECLSVNQMKKPITKLV